MRDGKIRVNPVEAIKIVAAKYQEYLQKTCFAVSSVSL